MMSHSRFAGLNNLSADCIYSLYKNTHIWHGNVSFPQIFLLV